MMEPVALWMLTMHLIGDFPLQPSWMAQKKAFLNGSEDVSRNWEIDGLVTLCLHVLIHAFLFLPIAYYTLSTFADMGIFMAWVVGTHFLIDMNRWVAPKEGWSNDGYMWVWLNDQIIHFAALSLAYPVVEIIHALA